MGTTEEDWGRNKGKAENRMLGHKKDPSCTWDSHMCSGNGFAKLPVNLDHPCRSILEVTGLVLNKTLRNMNLRASGVAQLIGCLLCMHEAWGSLPQPHTNPISHSCHPSTWELEAGGSGLGRWFSMILRT